MTAEAAEADFAPGGAQVEHGAQSFAANAQQLQRQPPDSPEAEDDVEAASNNNRSDGHSEPEQHSHLRVDSWSYLKREFPKTSYWSTILLHCIIFLTESMLRILPAMQRSLEGNVRLLRTFVPSSDSNPGPSRLDAADLWEKPLQADRSPTESDILGQ